MYKRQGKACPGIGEWIMKTMQIPKQEYAALAEKFNPAAFDARAWVSLAREAGMKYLAVSYTHLDVYKRQIKYSSLILF